MLKTRKQGIRNSLTGRAGEYTVASQLLIRNVVVFFPAIDIGVDLMTEDGCRIQVKSSHLRSTEKMIAKVGRGAYWFPLAKTKRRAVSRDKAVLVDRMPLSETCDVVVFWGIEENRFWIVPSALASRSTGLVLGGPDPGRFVGSVSDIKEMYKTGIGPSAIARHYDIDRVTVHNLLKSDKEFQGQNVTSQVRQCENAWGNIINFGLPDIQESPLHLVESIIESSQGA